MPNWVVRIGSGAASTTRMVGLIQPRSKEYFTKNASPSNNTTAPMRLSHVRPMSSSVCAAERPVLSDGRSAGRRCGPTEGNRSTTARLSRL